jgi:PKD repeat protein
MSNTHKTPPIVITSRYWSVVVLFVVGILAVYATLWTLGQANAQVSDDNMTSFDMDSFLIFSGQFTVTAAATGDVDNDGDSEIVISGHFTDGFQLRVVEGTLDYGIISSTLAVNAFALADFDNDSYADVVTVSNLTDTAEIRIWWNNHAPPTGTGNFLTNTLVGELSSPVLSTTTQPIAIGDLNHDGYLDIVSGDSVGQVVYWYPTNSPFEAWSHENVCPGSAGVTAIALADVDVNGRLDVVVSTADAGAFSDLKVHRNLREGEGVIFRTWDIAHCGGSVRSISFLDFDDDGDLDIATGYVTGDLGVLRNPQPEYGVYWAEHLVGSVSDAIHVLVNADLDNDGDLELVSGDRGSEGEITVWTKEASSWQPISLPVTGTLAFIKSTDWDRDGDADIILGSNQSGGFEIRWWTNTLVHRNVAFGGMPVSVGVVPGCVHALDVGDLDQDGYLDIVSGGCATDGNELILWPNQDLWSQSDVGSSNFDVLAVAIADLDNDGRSDIVSGNEDRELMAWQNEGAPFPEEWASPTLIETMLGPVLDIAIADLDHNGFLDVVAASSRLMIYANNGSPFGASWLARWVRNNDPAVNGVCVADLDNDGDQDIASASGDQIVIWGNPWNASADNDPFDHDNLWEDQAVSSTFAGAQAVVAADFDGDGLTDIAAVGDAGLYVWKNDGTPFSGLWSENQLSAASMTDLVVADLDHDGDPDLISSCDVGTDNDLTIWLNDGTPFDGGWSQHYAHDITGNVATLVIGDMDNDGDADLVRGGNAPTPGQIDLWYNLGGSALFEATGIPQALVNSLQAPFFQIIASHQGITGDHDIEPSQWALLFEAQPDIPLTTAEARDLISSIAVYSSTNATWEMTDTLAVTISSQDLGLDDGVQWIEFSGPGAAQIAPGDSMTYFIVLHLTADAVEQSPSVFRATFDPMMAVAIDSESDVPVRSQYARPAIAGFAPIASFVPNAQIALVGQTMIFTNTTQGTEPITYLWNLGDDSAITVTESPTHAYATIGDFTITLTATNDFGFGTYAQTITIGQLPSAAFLVQDDTVLPGATILFTSTSTSTSPDPLMHTWDFDDGSTPVNTTTQIISHDYLEPGVYTTTLTVMDMFGSSDPVIHPITVGSRPSADWEVSDSTVTIGQEVTFTSFIISGSPPFSYQWNLGDGSVVATDVATITHIYTDPNLIGPLDVILTVTDLFGSSEPVTHVITIGYRPFASFQIKDPTVTITQCAHLTNTAVGTNPISYLWDFDDSVITSTLDITVTHCYTEVGDYTVTLVASDTFGSSDPYTGTITVGHEPLASFLIEDPTVTITQCARFANTTTDTNPINYVWNFGNDVVTSTLDTTVTYCYTQTGDYTVALIATDTFGSSLYTDTLTVGNLPHVGFDISDPTATIDQKVTFTDTTVSSSPISCKWDLGNGTQIADTTTVSHTYTCENTDCESVPIPLPLPLTVTLTVTDVFGSAMASQPIAVGHAPIAAFSPSETRVTLSETFTLTNLSTGTFPIDFSWDLGDETTRSVTTTEAITHVYTIIGDFTITLTVSSDFGTDSYTQAVTVKDVPVARCSVNDDTIIPGTTVTFTSDSVGTGPLVYMWDFGDGDSDGPPSTRVISHEYDMPGIYLATLTVTDTYGSDTCTNTITVDDNPTASFGIEDPTVTITQCARFINTTTGTPPINYRWNFGNSVLSSTPDIIVTHCYTKTGDYTVTLVATDTFGSDLYTDTLTVGDLPLVEGLEVSDLTAAINQQVILTAHITASSPFSCTWDLGNGERVTGAATIPYTYTCENTDCGSAPISPSLALTVTLTATDDFGSSAPATHSITVGHAPEADFATDVHLVTTPSFHWVITLTNYSTGTGSVTHTWNLGGFGTLETPTDEQAVISCPVTGNCTATLTATSPFGQDSKSVTPVLSVHLPFFVKNYPIPFVNGGFENELEYGWTTGGELPTTRTPGDGWTQPLRGSDYAAKLGGDTNQYPCENTSNIHQNYAVISQTFTVLPTEPILVVNYRAFSTDVAWSSGEPKDTVEIHLNLFDPEDKKGRHAAICDESQLGTLHNDDSGLILCDGVKESDWNYCQVKETTPEGEWKEVRIDLTKHIGENVTIHFAVFNRKNGWFTTWAYLDGLYLASETHFNIHHYATLRSHR